MNENNGILNINNAANRFCGAYKEFGTSLDKIGSEIYQIQSQIEEKTRKYNIDIKKMTDFFSDNSITVDGYYNSLSDTEKYHDEKGNVVPLDLLTDEERAALEDQIRKMNEKQGDAKLEIVNMKAAIDKKTAEFERLIRQNKEQLRLATENLKNEKRNLKNQKNRIQTQIDDYEYKIENTKLDPAITNKSQLIADYRRQIGVSNVRMAILDSVSSAADVYQIVFDGILSNISVDMYDREETIALEEQYNKELTIANDIQKLVDGFNVAKGNYTKDKEKIAEIEKSIAEFKTNYQDMANANDFIKRTKAATKSLKDTIKAIEENNDLEKVFGSEQSPEQTSDETLEQSPEQNSDETPEQSPEQNPDETPEQSPEQDLDETPEQSPEQSPEQDLDETPEQSPEQDLDETPEQSQGLESTQNPDRSNSTDGAISRVVRQRKASSAKRHIAAVASGTLALAAVGLGFAPPVAALAMGTFGVSTALSIGSAVATAYKRKKITKKLNKIAKQIREEMGYEGFKLGEPDYANGTINFIIEDNDEKGMIVNSSNSDAKLVTEINNLLSKEFKNEDRGLNRKPTTKSEIDLGPLPKVTIDNLHAAYAEIGGVGSFRSDIFGTTSAYKTTPKLITEKRDKGKSENLKEADEYETVDYNELHNDSLNEEEVEEEIKLGETEQEPEVTEGDTAELLNDLESEGPNVPQEAQEIPDITEDEYPDMSDLVASLGDNESAELNDILNSFPMDPAQQPGRGRTLG